MQKKVFQLLVNNTSGVLSRITGLFSRRGYNIESITAGVTSDPEFSRITIVTSGDDEILEQIEKQGIIAVADIFRAKIVDVAPDSMMIELTGNQQKIDAFIGLLDGYDILEQARTGIAGLGRGTEHITYIEDDGGNMGL